MPRLHGKVESGKATKEELANEGYHEECQVKGTEGARGQTVRGGVSYDASEDDLREASLSMES